MSDLTIFLEKNKASDSLLMKGLTSVLMGNRSNIEVGKVAGCILGVAKGEDVTVSEDEFLVLQAEPACFYSLISTASYKNKGVSHNRIAEVIIERVVNYFDNEMVNEITLIREVHGYKGI
jgi:hypothetical protein